MLKSVNLEKFKEWFEKNKHHYDKDSVEDMFEMIQEYLKSTEKTK